MNRQSLDAKLQKSTSECDSPSNLDRLEDQHSEFRRTKAEGDRTTVGGYRGMFRGCREIFDRHVARRLSNGRPQGKRVAGKRSRLSMESLETRTLLTITTGVESLDESTETAWVGEASVTNLETPVEAATTAAQALNSAALSDLYVTGVETVTDGSTWAIEVHFSTNIQTNLISSWGSVVQISSIPNGDPVATQESEFSYDSATKTLTWQPSSTLESGRYEMVLTSSAFQSSTYGLLFGGTAGLQFSVTPLDNGTTLISGGSDATPCFADWDGDGVQDLLVGYRVGNYGKIRYHHNSGTNASPVWDAGVYLQNSTGSDFTYTASATTLFGASPAAASYDGDIYPDLFIGLADGTVRVLKNVNGTGKLADPNGVATYLSYTDKLTYRRVSLDTGTEATISLVDLNDDGNLDLLVGNSGGVVKVAWNKGNWNFSEFQLVEANGAAITLGSRITVAAGDMNGDGRKDLLVGTSDGRVLFYENIGTSTSPKYAAGKALTTAAGTAITAVGSARVAVQDLNGDGREDLLVANGQANNGMVKLYKATGNASVYDGEMTQDSEPGYDFRYAFQVGTTAQSGWSVSLGSDRVCNEGESQTFRLTATQNGENLNTSLYDVVWNFGDGTTATGSLSQLHTFTQTGSGDSVYTVKVQITSKSNGAVVAEKSVQVTVKNVAPSVSLAIPPSVTPNTSVTLTAVATDPGNDALSYRWFVNETQAGTNSTLQRSYTQGIYTIRVVVSDSSGATSERSGTLRVGVNAEPVLETLGNQTVANGAPTYVGLHATDEDGDAVTYSVTVNNANVSGGTLEANVLSSAENRSLRLTVSYVNTSGETKQGTLVFQLFEDLAPETTAKIIAMVQQGLYENLTFANMKQNVALTLGAGSATVSPFDDEFHPDLQFTTAGLIAMSRSENDANGVPFMITTGAARDYDFKSSIFGMLTEGSEFLSQLNAISTSSGTSSTTVTVKEAEIVTETRDAVLRLKSSAASGVTGTAVVTVSYSDGVVTRTKQFNVSLVADTVNDPAFLSKMDPITISQGSVVTLSNPAVDMEGNATTLKVATNNAGLMATVLDNQQIRVTASSTLPAGVYLLYIQTPKASTSDATRDSQYVPVFVNPAAPTIISSAESNTGDSSSTSTSTIPATANNNGNSNKKLSFTLSGLTVGATVTLYADGKAIGSTIATSNQMTVFTNGSSPLADGTHTITAIQTLASQPYVIGNQRGTISLASTASSSYELLVDTTAPSFLTVPSSNSVMQGEVWTSSVAANESGVQYSLGQDAPAGMTLDATSGALVWNVGSLAAGNYTITVLATDAAGNIGSSQWTMTVVEVTAVPNKPTNLSTQILGTSSIGLTWAASTGATSYAVYRRIGTGTWTAISSSVTTPNYTDSYQIQTNTKYSYKIVAINTKGPSPDSEIVSVTIAVPSAPKLNVNGNSTSQITVSWSSVTNATSYRVERSLNGTSNWTVMGETASLSVVDSGLDASTTYYYRAVALNGTLESPCSTTVSGTTQGIAVMTIAASGVSDGIYVTWSKVSGVFVYRLYNSPDGNTWSILTNPSASSTSFTQQPLSKGVVRYYKIEAVDGSNLVIAASAAVKATAGSSVRVSLSKDVVKENVRVGTTVGKLSASDRGKYIYSVSGEYASLFTVDKSGNLKTDGTIDYETLGNNVTLTIVARDASTLQEVQSEAVTVQITNVDEAPFGLTISNMAGGTVSNTLLVEEMAPVGTVIAKLQATDPEGDPISYVLASRNKYVEIVGNEVRILSQFSWIQLQSFQVKIRAISGRLKSADTVLNVQVTQKDYSSLTEPMVINMPSNKVTIKQVGNQVQLFNGSKAFFSAAVGGFPGFTIIGTGKNDTLVWDLNGWNNTIPISFNGNGGGDAMSVIGTSANDTFILADTGVKFGNSSVTLNNVGSLLIEGGLGDDTYRVEGLPSVPTTILDKRGVDTLDFSAASGTIQIDLGSTKAQSVLGKSLTVKSAIEILIGSQFDDQLTGSRSGNVIHGGAGSDRITAANGKNVLIGDAAADAILGGGGEDLLIGGTVDETNLVYLYNSWISSKSKFDERTTMLQNSLIPWVTDDGFSDTLTGGKSQDWFYGSGSDQITDLDTSKKPDRKTD